eukprot:365708-Chlamydomonas_euryale.AAC.7
MCRKTIAHATHLVASPAPFNTSHPALRSATRPRTSTCPTTRGAPFAPPTPLPPSTPRAAQRNATAYFNLLNDEGRGVVGALLACDATAPLPEVMPKQAEPLWERGFALGSPGIA